MTECYEGASTDAKDPRACEPTECLHKNGLCAVCCGCDETCQTCRALIEGSNPFSTHCDTCLDKETK